MPLLPKKGTDIALYKIFHLKFKQMETPSVKKYYMLLVARNILSVGHTGKVWQGFDNL